MLIKPDFGPSPAQRTEQIQRFRAPHIVAVALVFVILQIIFLIFDPASVGLGLRLLYGNTARVQQSLGVTAGMAAGTVGLAISSLLLLSGRGSFLDRTMRSLVEDESTLAHRRLATATGYWATISTVLSLYVYALFEPLTLAGAIHVVLSVGIGALLVRFALLEWRAVGG